MIEQLDGFVVTDCFALFRGNLNRHNVLEHDASMTRGDAFFGSNHAFNQTIFDETKQYWPDDLMTAEHLTNGKLARQVNSRALNPEYTFTTTMEQFSLGEVSAPIVAFGSFETYTTNRTLVEYWIREFDPLCVDYMYDTWLTVGHRE